ncbi:hypothetical protein B484DRAFT_335560, partial [Ochromonadaceae sp. CCMP2298]
MDNWVELQDETGRAYFFNEALNETAWELPAGASLEEWEELVDESSGNTYYFNPTLGVTQWEKPA